MRRARTALALTTCALSLVVLSGCQTDYAADVVNKTPQPLFVQLFVKGNTDSSLGASKRLGPGDRGFIGPVRHDKNQGAYLAFDTLGNPARPATVDIGPGTSFFEVQADSANSDGRLIIIQK